MTQNHWTLILPKDGMIKSSGKDISKVENQAERIEVRALMSGVFYRKPAPDQAPYVEVGDVVKKKQTLALLETMKVFQKIKSPVDGRVVEIVAKDEAALKDDDLLFVIERT